MSPTQDRLERYWRTNLRYLAILLSIWFAVSYGAGILFADALDQVRVFGFRLGFWFAQQGSIYVFVVLILVYVQLMNRLDARFEVDEQDDEPDSASFDAQRELALGDEEGGR